jgi:uncharacterized protein YycO
LDSSTIPLIGGNFTSNESVKIGIVIVIIALFICINITNSVADDTIKQSSIHISNGKNLYMNEHEQESYTTIKDTLNETIKGIKISKNNIVKRKSFWLNPDITNTINKYDCKVPDCVKIGDILIMDMILFQKSKFMIPGPYNEHSALYIGYNKFIHAGGDENATVCIRDYYRFYKSAKNLAFIRVTTANSTQTQAAVEFALKQLGKSFQSYSSISDFPWFDIKYHKPNHPWFPRASKWYCIELPWAAYYNQGIDIDSNGWRLNKPGYRPIVSINEIIEDNDTEIIYHELDDYIEIIHPNGGTYVANRKVSYFPFWWSASVLGKINVIVDTNLEPYSVKIYIGKNGMSPAHTDYDEPYNWTWDEKGFGKHTLKVVAFDENGKELGSYETLIKKFL